MQIYDAVSAMIVMKQRDKEITIYETTIFLKLLSHIVEEDIDRRNRLGDWDRTIRNEWSSRSIIVFVTLVYIMITKEW